MYRQKIKSLEESYKKINDELFFLQKNNDQDTTKISRLSDTRTQMLSELNTLRKLQYEYDQEVKFTDYDR